MVRTMLPIPDGDPSREHENETFRAMMESRRASDALPIGRRILQAEVFGTNEHLVPFEFPEPLLPLRREAMNN